MKKLMHASVLLIGGSLMLSACASIESKQKQTKQQAAKRVQSLNSTLEKTVALAVLHNSNTIFRIDNHGLPAWTWRGKNDIGACVHLDPKTGKPYLETQFSKAERKSSPKYINYETNGKNWRCRNHIQGFGIDYEKNWASPNCHREGKLLLIKLHIALGE